MAIRTIDDSKLQNIAVAIQGKDGGGTMTVDQMPTRIAEIPTRDNTTLNSLIDRGITSIENDEVTSIGFSAFYGCSNLTSVSFPNATSIGFSAFQGCSNLTSVSFPNATSIGVSAFQGCSNLPSVSFPNATSIRVSAFRDCSNLPSVSFPNATRIESSAFYSCSKLTSVSFPNATSIGVSAFQGCSNLPSVSFPNVTSIGVGAFQDCSNLSILILGKRATLSNSNAFSGADNAITYVQPEDLSWYSTATNWSTLYANNRIKSIEDLTGDDLVWYQEQLARYQSQTA